MALQFVLIFGGNQLKPAMTPLTKVITAESLSLAQRDAEATLQVSKWSEVTVFQAVSVHRKSTSISSTPANQEDRQP